METRCVIIELKPGSENRVKEWAAFILENKSEALRTLSAEKVIFEGYYLSEYGSKKLLIGIMRAKSLELASQVVKDSLSAIDAYHQQFKTDCWDGVFSAVPILELEL